MNILTPLLTGTVLVPILTGKLNELLGVDLSDLTNPASDDSGKRKKVRTKGSKKGKNKEKKQKSGKKGKAEAS